MIEWLTLIFSILTFIAMIYSIKMQINLNSPELSIDCKIFNDKMTLNIKNARDKTIWIKDFCSDKEKLFRLFKNPHLDDMGMVLEKGHFHYQEEKLIPELKQSMKKASCFYVLDSVGKKFYMTDKDFKKIKQVLSDVYV